MKGKQEVMSWMNYKNLIFNFCISEMSKNLILILFSLIIISCKQENKFVLRENASEINEIILSVISEDSLAVTKNNTENNN